MEIKFGQWLIRNYSYDDKLSLIKYANDPEVAQNLLDSFPHPYTESDADYWLNFVHNQDICTNFALADSVELIGAIGLVLHKGQRYCTANIGYWLGKPFWGKGIMSQALKYMTTFAFEKYELRKIYAEVFEGNIASMKVLEKAGYTLEATFKKHFIKFEKEIDCLIYSIFREELKV